MVRVLKNVFNYLSSFWNNFISELLINEDCHTADHLLVGGKTIATVVERLRWIIVVSAKIITLYLVEKLHSFSKSIIIMLEVLLLILN